MSNKKTFWTIVPFISLIFGISIVNILKTDNVSSLYENRTLTQKPNIRSMNIKDFTTTFESYYTDQFVGREKLMRYFTNQQIKLNKSTVRDHYVLKNNWILPLPMTKITDETIKQNANKINNLSKDLHSLGKDVIFTMNPCKSIVLDYLYPSYVDNNTGYKDIYQFMNLLDSKYIKGINVTEHFVNDYSNEEKNKLFFKTDHHWTGYGAYKGFQYMMKNMGIDVNDSDYNFDVDSSKQFLGSYDRNLFDTIDENEPIEYIYPKSHNYKYYSHNGYDFSEVKGSSIISTERNLETIGYGGAYTFDYPLYKITNENAPIKKSILIVRDSYQAPTSLLFADKFESVTVLDPRHIGEIGKTTIETIKNDSSDIVMIMLNSENFIGMIDLIN